MLSTAAWRPVAGMRPVKYKAAHYLHYFFNFLIFKTISSQRTHCFWPTCLRQARTVRMAPFISIRLSQGAWRYIYINVGVSRWLVRKYISILEHYWKIKWKFR